MEIPHVRAHKIISDDFTLIFKSDKITNPLKSMFVLISSLKLSTVPYAAGSESHSRTAYMAIYR
jgi:hypothetical protein